MTKIATKKRVNNGLAYEFNIKKSDVVRRHNFDSWEVIETTKGIMFKTYTGFHIFTTPYVANQYAEVNKTSLYAHLKNLLDMAEAWKDTMGEKFDATDDAPDAVTKGELFDSLKIVTEAVCTMPTFAFADENMAVKISGFIIDRLKELTDKMAEAINQEPSSEEENLKAEALEIARVQNAEVMAEMIKEVEDAESGEH